MYTFSKCNSTCTNRILVYLKNWVIHFSIYLRPAFLLSPVRVTERE